MRTILVYVIALTSIAIALPVDNSFENDLAQLLKALESPATVGRNSAIENLLLNLIEDLRKIMLTGNDDIPVLDPFNLEHLALDDNTIPVEGAKLEIKDLTVDNLSTFEVNSLTAQSAGNIFQIWYDINLDAEIPVLDVDADYYDLLIDIFGLNFFGNGDAKITIVKPRVKLYVQVAVSLGLGTAYITIRECNIVISLEDINFGIKGLFNDPSVDHFVNTFLRNLVLEALGVYSDEITEAVSPIVKDIANDILKDLNLISIIGGGGS